MARISGLELTALKSPVKKTGQFIAVLGKVKPGEKLTLHGTRAGQEISLEVTLGKWK